MRSGTRRIATGVVGSLLASVCGLTLYFIRPAPLEHLSERLEDALCAFFPPPLPDPSVIIVGIDTRSLREIGGWPWPPETVSRLIGFAAAGRPRVIGIDLCSDSDGEDCERLEGAVRRARRVVAGYKFRLSPGGAPVPAGALSSSRIRFVTNPWGSVRRYDVAHAWGVECLSECLVRAAVGSGFSNIIPDHDGLVRRVPLVLSNGGAPHRSFSVAVTEAFRGAGRVTLRLSGDSVLGVEVDGERVRSDSGGNLLLRFYDGEDTIPVISASDLLRGTVGPAIFKNKIVLLGGTDRGEFPFSITRCAEEKPGVYIQGTAVENILRDQYLRTTPLSRTVEVVLVVLLPLSIPLFCPRCGESWFRFLVPVGAVAAIICLAIWLLTTRAEAVSVFYPSLSVIFSLLLYCAGTRRPARR